MRKTRFSLKEQIAKRVVSESVKMADRNVNSACAWWLNQPEIPLSVREAKQSQKTTPKNSK